MLFFWYCFDEWVAQTSGQPWLGHVPWIVIVLLHFPLALVVGHFIRRGRGR